jgi:FkbM family methyltransferase
MILKDIISEKLIKLANYIYPRDFFLESLNKNGILNWKDSSVSGELYFIKVVLPEIIGINDQDIINIFDIGANKGHYTLMLIDNLKSKFKDKTLVFHLFEPQPIQLLQEVLNDHSELNIIINKNAVGNKNGFIELFSESEGSEHATTVDRVLTDNHKYKNFATNLVPMIRLDQYMIDNNLGYINFIKIDTEGNEFDVLKGLGDFLTNQKTRIIQFEFNEMNVYSRVFFKDFYDLLTSEYEIFRLGPASLIRIYTYDTFLEVFKFQNYVAISKDVKFV